MEFPGESVGGEVGQVDTVRSLLHSATQRLLGDTILIEDAGWRERSRLPGWTRGHVATHVARQAAGLLRVVSGARSGQAVPMDATPEQRDREIEEGAGRAGLDLQVDLDTSAGALADAFEGVEADGAWDLEVELRGLRAPLRVLPLARLAEVELHHVDLDVGYQVEGIDDDTANRLLEWLAIRLASRPDFPRLRATSPSTSVLVGGAAGAAVEVTGPGPRLLGWLSGRSGDDQLSGAEGITLPAF